MTNDRHKSIRLPAAQLLDLKLAAKRAGCSESAIVRRALAEHLARRPGPEVREAQ